MSNNKKYLRFQKPMQLFIHGQWWSMFSTHLLQLEQWWHLSGLKMLHMRQYLRLLFSESPRWKPQNTGTWPGSVVIAWMKDHIIIMNMMWNNMSIAIVGVLSKTKGWLAKMCGFLTGLRKPYQEGVSIVDDDNHAQHEENEHVANYLVSNYWNFLGHFPCLCSWYWVVAVFLIALVEFLSSPFWKCW